MERYYAETSKGGRGWPTWHFVYDRAIHPPLAIAYRKTRKQADKLAEQMSGSTGPWALPGRPLNEDGSYMLASDRMRVWAATTKAFTTNNRDLSAQEAA